MVEGKSPVGGVRQDKEDEREQGGAAEDKTGAPAPEKGEVAEQSAAAAKPSDREPEQGEATEVGSDEEGFVSGRNTRTG